MALLTVVSTFGDKDAGTINTTRLLRFVDPPPGILETAKLLQKQMITHFPGKITSEIFGHPPDEERVSQTRLGRCSNKTRRKALPPGLSPKDELEDLYHHVSNHDDGLVCIRDQNSFVASERNQTIGRGVPGVRPNEENDQKGSSINRRRLQQCGHDSSF